MFGEKSKEYSAKAGCDVDVIQTSKYKEARQKAIDIINGKKFGIEESDFWILMNAMKNGKMAYTGLIISHNGCLKINDRLESKFKPEYVILDKDGYAGSLVYSYCCPEQGIFEVGEVSQKNCQNAYPYAMAFKRLFDRVVLKLSKLAYAGIYSDSESEEFVQRFDDEKGEDGFTDLGVIKAAYKGENLKKLLESNGVMAIEDLPAEKIKALAKFIRDKAAAKK